MTLPEKLLNEQRSSTNRLVAVSMLAVPVLAATALFTQNAVLPIAICAGLTTALALVLSRLSGDIARLGAALACTTQSLILVAAFSGHPWQMDSHLLIIAALILVSTLVDTNALLASAGLIALHHLGLSFMAPQLAFDGSALFSNVERTALHTGAVLISTTALIQQARRRIRLEIANEAGQAKAIASAAAAREAEAEAVLARQDAEEERQAAIAAKDSAETAAKLIQENSAARYAAELAIEEERARTARQERDDHERTRNAINALRRVINALAAGDLQVRLDDDMSGNFRDLQGDFNSAVEALHNAFTDISTHTNLIRGETDDIAESAEDLAQRTEQQAQTLEALAASMNRLSGLISSAANDAKQAETAVLATRSDAEASALVMTKAISAMGEIEATSAEVRKITTVIDDIAFQTNLLALNAGVEAARAGNAGRGFAVVASEVRALARRSSEAASRINSLIGQSASQIQDGVTLVRSTGTALEEIIASVSQASERMVQIAATSADQAEGISRINTDLRDLDAGAQKNAAMFEETTAACIKLRSSAEALGQSVDTFGTGQSRHSVVDQRSVA